MPPQAERLRATLQPTLLSSSMMVAREGTSEKKFDNTDELRVF
jgi:hypothetical protein